MIESVESDFAIHHHIIESDVTGRQLTNFSISARQLICHRHYLTNQATMYIYAPKSLVWRASCYCQ